MFAFTIDKCPLDQNYFKIINPNIIKKKNNNTCIHIFIRTKKWFH